MSQNLKWFSGRYFETVGPIFDFLLHLGFFGVLYQWPKFQQNVHSAKYVSDVGSIWMPLLTTNGRTEDLDHLSVKYTAAEPHWHKLLLTQKPW